MGLFLGFSIVSLAEIFYFAILKPIFDVIIPFKKIKPTEPESTDSLKEVQTVIYINEFFSKPHNFIIEISTMDKSGIVQATNIFPKTHWRNL